MTQPTAFITGARGQDGSYLIDLLLDKGYEVHGMVRRHSAPYHRNIDHVLNHDRFHLHEGDVTDLASLHHILNHVQPDEVYNLAAQSQVGVSFKQPNHTFEATGLGAYNVFEACRHHCPDARIYQAGSSEQYGQVATQDGIHALNEEHPFRPVSPYAVAKTFAHGIAHTYRTAYDMHISVGLLFNHESERRGQRFVTRKITVNLALIKHGLKDSFSLGNLQAKRDWGHAADYVEGMWRMLQQEDPQDYVLATGESWSVNEFLHAAYQHADIPQPLDDIVDIGEQHFRPADIPVLRGDATKAHQVLGWEPDYRFHDLVWHMVEADMQRVAAGEITAYQE